MQKDKNKMTKSMRILNFTDTSLDACVNGPCLLDYLILKLRLPVVLYVCFAVDSR